MKQFTFCMNVQKGCLFLLDYSQRIQHLTFPEQPLSQKTLWYPGGQEGRHAYVLRACCKQDNADVSVDENEKKIGICENTKQCQKLCVEQILTNREEGKDETKNEENVQIFHDEGLN